MMVISHAKEGVIVTGRYSELSSLALLLLSLLSLSSLSSLSLDGQVFPISYLCVARTHSSAASCGWADGSAGGAVVEAAAEIL